MLCNIRKSHLLSCFMITSEEIALLEKVSVVSKPQWGKEKELCLH